MRFFYVICFVLSLLLTPGITAAVGSAKEYEIKAAFLIRLGQFVYWPSSAFANKESPFNICTLGNDSFLGALEFLQKTYTYIRKHPIHVQHHTMPQETLDCHILFVDKSETLRLNQIFQQVENKPILLVSDLEGFAIKGGMVQFLRRNNKIRLLIAPKNFMKADLKPSANLMGVSDLLDP